MKTSLFLSLFIAITIFSSCDYLHKKVCAYERWDSTQDDSIHVEEFLLIHNKDKAYSIWDTDSDGILSEKEWKEGVEKFYSGKDLRKDKEFVEWDLDEDEKLDEDEFAISTFSVWDTDKDGSIDEVELVKWCYEVK